MINDSCFEMFDQSFIGPVTNLVSLVPDLERDTRGIREKFREISEKDLEDKMSRPGL